MGLKRKPPAGNVRRVAPISINARGVMTNKRGREVQHESWAEFMLILWFERDPDVVGYASQPETFEFIDSDGKKHSYTPDFIVWRTDGTVEIHEVTLEKRRSEPSAFRREEAAREICRRRGWGYIVHTENSLPQATETANLSMLFFYRPAAYASFQVARSVREKLGNGSRIPLDHLVVQIAEELVLPQHAVRPPILHMLWHGHLAVDLTRLLIIQGEIARNTYVWLAQKGEQ